MNIDYKALPVLSKDIIARRDSNGILLFQVKSDEMYFISLAAYESFVTRCNGSQTLQEITDEIQSNGSFELDRESYHRFIKELYNRQIIELW